METSDFQRARSEAQRQERRAALLTTAERLLKERGDVSAFSLNELAREAGMAKSNVYRYFESRESLLLELLEDQWQKWFLAFEKRTKNLSNVELDEFCAALCQSLAKHRLLCSLMSSLPSVLEHNASVETMRGFKLRSIESLRDAGQFCSAKCPTLSSEEFEEWLHQMTIVMTSLWAYANPAESVRELLKEPELANLRRDFPRDLSRTMTLLARGVVASRTR